MSGSHCCGGRCRAGNDATPHGWWIVRLGSSLLVAFLIMTWRKMTKGTVCVFRNWFIDDRSNCRDGNMFVFLRIINRCYFWTWCFWNKKSFREITMLNFIIKMIQKCDWSSTYQGNQELTHLCLLVLVVTEKQFFLITQKNLHFHSVHYKLLTLML